MATKVTRETLIKSGINAAIAILKTELQAEQAKSSIILEFAHKYAGDATNSKVVLEGYQQGYIENGSSESIAKVRTSEARAVFKALAATEVSEANYKQLKSFNGGYHAFIDLARQLQGGKAERNSGGEGARGERVKQSLTDKQYDKTEQFLQTASVPQKVELVETAIETIHKHSAPELAGFQSLLLIQATASQMISNEKIEEVVRTTAQDVLDIVEPMITRLQTAKRTLDENLATVQNQRGAVDVKEAIPVTEKQAANA